jgi:hypothetical protein
MDLDPLNNEHMQELVSLRAVCLSVFLSVCVCVCLSVCLSVCLCLGGVTLHIQRVLTYAMMYDISVCLLER